MYRSTHHHKLGAMSGIESDTSLLKVRLALRPFPFEVPPSFFCLSQSWAPFISMGAVRSRGAVCAVARGT